MEMNACCLTVCLNSNDIWDLDKSRSLEEALADIVEKYNRTPTYSSSRPVLERMIRDLEEENDP